MFENLGRQTDVTDVATGEDWNTGYNLLGQATSKKDPDAGTTTMLYDAADNVAETTDARGKAVSYTYAGFAVAVGDSGSITS